MWKQLKRAVYMICSICKKNPATIHIQEIIGGEKKTLHICAECAAHKSQNDPLFQGFNLAEMLYNLSTQMEAVSDDQSGDDGQPVVEAVCDSCGWDTTKFRKTGRMGCSECYKVFSEILAPALKNMHRGTLHVGKKPGSSSNTESAKIMMEIMNLQKELEELVLREEYEKAAKTRDKINELKNKN